MDNLILKLIQLLLVGLIIWSFYLIIRYTRKHNIRLTDKFFLGFGLGYLTDLLDTLGIGTFATSTTLFRATKLVTDDRKIPATITTAHVIPVLVEALCFITIIQVDIVTLICMALSAFAGAFFGARVSSNWNTQKVQRILGILLLIAAAFTVYRMITNPGEGLDTNIRGLYGWQLIAGIIFEFIIGILMSMGLGNYAPELIFFSLMGISPAIALPVMMLNAAMILVAGAKQFIESGRVNWPGIGGIIIGGILGVLTAAFFLTGLSVEHLKILVVVIVTYTGFTLLKTSYRK